MQQQCKKNCMHACMFAQHSTIGTDQGGGQWIPDNISRIEEGEHPKPYTEIDCDGDGTSHKVAGEHTVGKNKGTNAVIHIIGKGRFELDRSTARKTHNV